MNVVFCELDALKQEGDAYSAEYNSFSAALMKWTKQAFFNVSFSVENKACELEAHFCELDALKREGDACTAEYYSFSAAASMNWTKQAFFNVSFFR